MVKKAKIVRTTTVEEAPADSLREGNADLLDDEAARPDENEILRDLAEIDDAGEVRWNISRLLPLDKAGYCLSVSSGDLRLDVLADRLGPGKYRIRGHYPSGTYAGGRTVTIADDVARKSKESAATGAGNIADMLAVLQDREAARSDATLKWVTALAPVAAAVLPNLFKGTQLSDLTAALANMKALQPEPPNALETFIRGIEAAKALQPEEKAAGSTMLDVIRDIAGPLIGKMSAPGATPVAPSAPVPSQLSHAPAQPVEGDPMQQLIPWMRAALASLIEQARKNKDAALYAEVTLDNLPDGIPSEKLREYIGRADWWMILQQFHAGVAPYEGWFTNFRNEALSLIEDQLHGGDPDSLLDAPPAEAIMAHARALDAVREGNVPQDQTLQDDTTPGDAA